MTIRLQKILLPTDFSNYSAAATKYACELATKFDAELHLLHTLETHLASTPDFGLGPRTAEIRQRVQGCGGKVLGRCSRSELVGRSNGRSKAVVEGSPKVEIIATPASMIST